MEFLGATLVCGLVAALIVGFIVMVIYLVKRTNEEETAAKAELLEIVNTLPSEQQAAFFVQYNAQRKDPSTAVLLALFLGSFGAHKFYLGKTGLGILYLCFCWTTLATWVSFVEAFTVSRTVVQYNRDLAQKTMAMLTGNISATYL